MTTKSIVSTTIDIFYAKIMWKYFAIYCIMALL